jgi:hypothetical protein
MAFGEAIHFSPSFIFEMSSMFASRTALKTFNLHPKLFDLIVSVCVPTGSKNKPYANKNHRNVIHVPFRLLFLFYHMPPAVAQAQASLLKYSTIVAGRFKMLIPPGHHPGAQDKCTARGRRRPSCHLHRNMA